MNHEFSLPHLSVVVERTLPRIFHRQFTNLPVIWSRPEATLHRRFVRAALTPIQGTEPMITRLPALNPLTEIPPEHRSRARLLEWPAYLKRPERRGRCPNR